jgi:hypothetical protein
MTRHLAGRRYRAFAVAMLFCGLVSARADLAQFMGSSTAVVLLLKSAQSGELITPFQVGTP